MVTYPQVIIEAISVSDILRRIGFSADDVGIDDSRLPRVTVAVRKGEETYGFIVGDWEEETPFQEVWSNALDDWNENRNDPLSGWDTLVERSASRRMAVEKILFPLAKAGMLKEVIDDPSP